jgi:hypothetical protein
VRTRILSFLSDKVKKKEDCDSYALEHFGGPVGTVRPQGTSSYSYTVTAAGGETIVQFRDNTSRLPNMAFSELISNTHPELVAIPTFKGIFGPDSSSGLCVYYMNALPGLNFTHMLTISDPDSLADANGLCREPCKVRAYIQYCCSFL